MAARWHDPEVAGWRWLGSRTGGRTFSGRDQIVGIGFVGPASWRVCPKFRDPYLRPAFPSARLRIAAVRMTLGIAGMTDCVRTRAWVPEKRSEAAAAETARGAAACC